MYAFRIHILIFRCCEEDKLLTTFVLQPNSYQAARSITILSLLVSFSVSLLPHSEKLKLPKGNMYSTTQIQRKDDISFVNLSDSAFRGFACQLARDNFCSQAKNGYKS